jgi:ABC-type dipeptide/oligopeptide/nickel transport system permease subunit
MLLVKKKADSAAFGRSTPAALAWRRLRGNRAATAGLVIMCAFVFVALLAPVLAPYPYDVTFDNIADEPVGPSLKVYSDEENRYFTGPDGRCAGRHLLGLDDQYRDMLSRILYGARVSLLVGVVATLISLIVGVLVGALSGYFGGWVDNVLMRLTDTFMAFPSFLLAIAITGAVSEPSIMLVFVALGLAGWTSIARVVRSQVLTVKGNEYIQAARALGAGHLRILLRHVLPNSIAPIIVIGTLSVAGNILAEAGLSFLGIGVQPPAPSWGTMLGASVKQADYPWMSIIPGVAIMLTVLGFNLLGDGLRDALDPKMGTRG